MNIEESLIELKNYIKDKTNPHFDNYGFATVRAKQIQAIETLLTAYEKEKGENVKLRLQDIPLIEGELKAYKDRGNELKQELEKEKEKNKSLEQENSFLKMMYRGTDEFKAIEKLAGGIKQC